MDKSLILKKISEISETDISKIKETSKLNELDSWDSLAKVTFLAFAINEYGVKNIGEAMLDAETVSDLISIIEGNQK